MTTNLLIRDHIIILCMNATPAQIPRSSRASISVGLRVRPQVESVFPPVTISTVSMAIAVRAYTLARYRSPLEISASIHHQSQVEDGLDDDSTEFKSGVHDGREAVLYSASGSPSESSDRVRYSDIVKEQPFYERESRPYGPFHPVHEGDLPHQPECRTPSVSSDESDPAFMYKRRSQPYNMTGPTASSSVSEIHSKSEDDYDAVSDDRGLGLWRGLRYTVFSAAQSFYEGLYIDSESEMPSSDARTYIYALIL